MYYNVFICLHTYTIFLGSQTAFWLCLQRVYDEEVEENITKTDGLEKQPELV